MTLTQALEVIIDFLFQLFIVFPYSALTIQRQRVLEQPRHIESSSEREKSTTRIAMISEKVHKLCTSTESVSSLLAQEPTLAPGEAWKKLYGGHAAGEKESTTTAKSHRDEITPEDLQRALECGKWGPTQPSELFLRVSLPLPFVENKTNPRNSCTTMHSAHSIKAFPDVWSAHR